MVLGFVLFYSNFITLAKIIQYYAVVEKKDDFCGYFSDTSGIACYFSKKRNFMWM